MQSYFPPSRIIDSYPLHDLERAIVTFLRLDEFCISNKICRQATIIN